ncbi:hypothetical protein ACKWTF_015297 [Chironomus riparius]
MPSVCQLLVLIILSTRLPGRKHFNESGKNFKDFHKIHRHFAVALKLILSNFNVYTGEIDISCKHLKMCKVSGNSRMHQVWINIPNRRQNGLQTFNLQGILPSSILHHKHLDSSS